MDDRSGVPFALLRAGRKEPRGSLESLGTKTNGWEIELNRPPGHWLTLFQLTLFHLARRKGDILQNVMTRIGFPTK